MKYILIQSIKYNYGDMGIVRNLEVEYSIETQGKTIQSTIKIPGHELEDDIRESQIICIIDALYA